MRSPIDGLMNYLRPPRAPTLHQVAAQIERNSHQLSEAIRAMRKDATSRLKSRWPTATTDPFGFVTRFRDPLNWHIAIKVGTRYVSICDFRHQWPWVHQLFFLPQRLCPVCARYYDIDRC